MSGHQAIGRMVTIEFIGGPRDGEVLAGDVEGPESLSLSSVFRQLDGGNVGERVWVPTEYAIAGLKMFSASQTEVVTAMGVRFPGHIYHVGARRTDSDSLHLRLQHDGPSE